MTQPRQPQLLDVVAVLHSAGQSDLEVGDVGTVVELLPPDGLEVESSIATAAPAASPRLRGATSSSSTASEPALPEVVGAVP